jgi:hypothetical protein
LWKCWSSSVGSQAGFFCFWCGLKKDVQLLAFSYLFLSAWLQGTILNWLRNHHNLMEQLEDGEVVLGGVKGSLDFLAQCPKWGRWWINKLAPLCALTRFYLTL